MTLPDHGTSFERLELLIWIFNPEQALSTMLYLTINNINRDSEGAEHMRSLKSLSHLHY